VKTKNECNKRREGYYYNPHYEIKVKSFDRVESVMPDFLSVVNKNYNNGNNSVTFNCLQSHYLTVGDKSMVFDKVNNKYYDCTTINGDNDNYNTFTCLMYDEQGQQVNPSDVFGERPLNEFKFFKLDNLAVPSYAKVLKDGTCRVIWRNILNNGFGNDESVEEYPFTNGAFYVNKTINIYVRRQDPYGIWGLYSNEDISGDDVYTDQEDNYVKADEIVC
jgi:hypothetical protein